MIIAPVVMLATTLQDVDGAALYKRVLPSIATLTVVHKDGKSSLGTGFLAYKPGLMVTAWHVVENAKSVTAKFSDGEEFECTGIVDKDINRDVAIIRVKAVGKPLLAVADDKPDVGAKAFIVGAPRGLDFSISDGIISQIDTIDGKKIIQYTCPTSPGNSGGPLLDSTGKVRGVVSFLLRDSQNLNFAVPISYVSGFDLSLPTVPWNESGSKSDSRLLVLNKDASQLDDRLIEVEKLYRTSVMIRNNFHQLERENEFFGYNGPPKGVLATYRQLVTFAQINGGVKFESNNIVWQEAQDIVSRLVLIYEHLIKWFELSGNAATTHARLADVMFTELRAGAYASSYKKYIASDTFVSKLPIGSRPLEKQVCLGLDALPDNPLQVITVHEDGLGQRLGVKAKDTFLSCELGELRDMSDFESIIMANLGKAVKVRVIRNKKEIVLTMKVPSQLPKEFLPKK